MKAQREYVIAPGDRYVPWADSLASDWGVCPLKTRCAVNQVELPEDTRSDFRLRYVDIGSVDSNGMILQLQEMEFGDAPSRARRILKLGDTFLSTVRTYLRAIGFCDNGLAGAICSTGFAVLTPGPFVHPRFLTYWVRSTKFVDEIVARSTGVSYPAINAAEIGNLPFPIVPLSRQRAIADYLDRKTAGIDGLIAKKERLVELLHEKRQALISQAVTQGLNPNAPLKDSGIEWLGMVPHEWPVQRLKWTLRRVEQGWCPPSDNHPALAGEWGVLKVGCMNSGSYVESENKVLPPDVEPLTEYEVQIGDVLMSRSNTVELVGCVGRVDKTQGRILVCDKLYRLWFAEGVVDPDFVVLLLRSKAARQQIEREASGASSSMKNISVEVVGGLVLPIPPIEEQRRIAKVVFRGVARLDDLQMQIQTQISKLREYRQTLISAAVTGQIDVTAAARTGGQL